MMYNNDMNSGKSLVKRKFFDNKISHFSCMISNSILKVGGIELESLDFFARNKNNFQSNIRQICQKGRFYGKFLH